MASKWMGAVLVILAMAVPLAGCGSEAKSAGLLVRDSAGVQIVENGPIKELPPAFLISPTPRMDLGGAKKSPDQELDPRAPFLDAARLSDGRYVVSDMSAVKVFDAKGRYVSTIGRSGDGPGEFRQLRATCVAHGDAIVSIGYTPHRSARGPGLCREWAVPRDPGLHEEGGANPDHPLAAIAHPRHR
jgi:hypothetical protein